MRRLNRRLEIWLYSQPLWRFLVAYFVITLALGYAIFSAGNWILGHLFHLPGRSSGSPTINLLAIAAVTTAIGLIGRRTGRRRLGLLPPRQPPQASSGT